MMDKNKAKLVFAFSLGWFSAAAVASYLLKQQKQDIAMVSVELLQKLAHDMGKYLTPEQLNEILTKYKFEDIARNLEKEGLT